VYIENIRYISMIYIGDIYQANPDSNYSKNNKIHAKSRHPICDVASLCFVELWLRLSGKKM